MVIVGAMSAVNAADLNQTDTVTADNDDVVSQDFDEEVSVEDNTNDSNVLSGVHNSTNFDDLKSDVSSANKGDTIILNGYYSFGEVITVDKQLNFVGQNNAVVDGLSKVRLFKITANGVTFENITFKNGYTTWEGGAIILPDLNMDFHAENCTFINNTSKRGGAVYGGTVVNCMFINNFVNVYNQYGGAIYHGSAINCSFTGNSAYNGGAIAEGNAFNCNFTNNIATSTGGAIRNGNAFNCSFVNNSAIKYSGGAIYKGSAWNCSFVNNSANSLTGGAIYSGCAFNCSFTLLKLMVVP